eukprot:symbB.v1.2.006945.t1/scaffold416.1/size293898/4
MATCEVKLKTLEGGVLAVEVAPTNTIQELKAMLHGKKHCEDPIEHKILKVQVLFCGSLVGDDQTLESAGLLHGESEATVIFSRNQVEAASKHDIHAEGFLRVNIPSSLAEIGAGAFRECNQVVMVEIPESVMAIGKGAFEGCKSLASITIPESVMAIGGRSFAGCESLAGIKIPESVGIIGDRAFSDCSSLANITIPNSVTVIPTWAFQKCESLAGVNIPQSVTAIGGKAFAGCESLSGINIPESVTAIGFGAFEGCKSLSSINIPESVTAIGGRSFAGCESLAGINIPESNLGKCQGLLAIAVAAWFVTSSSLRETFAFVGQSTHVREPTLSARRISVTGEHKEIIRDSEEWKDSSMDKWWWQKEGYLTPRGYRHNPNWDLEVYKIACNEARYGAIERVLINELKAKGMTIEEIRQKASVYEFVEGVGNVKVCKPDSYSPVGELVDLNQEIANSPPSYTYSGEPGADIFRDWDWEGIAR